MKGIINFYKPKGITSSDAVVACRKILGTRAIGHMGTLDPMGEGVLLLGVGKATRLFDYFLKKDKVYEAEFAFGYETDTLDSEGKIADKTDSVPDIESIKRVLSAFSGKQMQIPPSYSAKSVNGVRSYKMAREGNSVELAACPIEIYSLRLLRQTAENVYLFEIHCSSGTYIRSICRDLAHKLGTLATMTSIKRTRCGHFTCADAVTADKLEKIKENALITAEEALKPLNTVILPDEYYTPLCNGIKIPSETEGDFALYCKKELFGIANSEGGYIKIKSYLRD